MASLAMKNSTVVVRAQPASRRAVVAVRAQKAEAEVVSRRRWAHLYRAGRAPSLSAAPRARTGGRRRGSRQESERERETASSVAPPLSARQRPSDARRDRSRRCNARPSRIPARGARDCALARAATRDDQGQRMGGLLSLLPLFSLAPAPCRTRSSRRGRITARGDVALCRGVPMSAAPAHPGPSARAPAAEILPAPACFFSAARASGERRGAARPLPQPLLAAAAAAADRQRSPNPLPPPPPDPSSTPTPTTNIQNENSRAAPPSASSAPPPPPPPPPPPRPRPPSPPMASRPTCLAASPTRRASCRTPARASRSCCRRGGTRPRRRTLTASPRRSCGE